MKRVSIISIFIIVAINLAFSQVENTKRKLDFHEQLLYTTIRIVVAKKDNGKLIQGTGTGFYFDFAESENASRPYIVTNRHVVENSIIGGFELILKDKMGNPDSLTQQLLIPNFANQWIHHPDSKVDLCIMPLAKLINEAHQKKIDFFYKSFRSKNIPTEEEWNSLNVIENVLMIGYPIGLIDTLNNIPLIRTGTTSSPPFKNFNGKKEFVIDAGCFPGSSGSPVIYNPQPIKFSARQKKLNEFLFLGILYAGPEMKLSREIVIRKIPIEANLASGSSIPINVGYIIKSDRINDFRVLIDK